MVSHKFLCMFFLYFHSRLIKSEICSYVCNILQYVCTVFFVCVIYLIKCVGVFTIHRLSNVNKPRSRYYV